MKAFYTLFIILILISCGRQSTENETGDTSASNMPVLKPDTVASEMPVIEDTSNSKIPTLKDTSGASIP